MGLLARLRGSEEWPQRTAFCAIPAGYKRRKKNVPTEETGGGRGTVLQPSPPRFQRLMNHTNCGGCCLENPGPVAAVSTGARSGGWRGACKAAFDPDLEQGGNTNLVTHTGDAAHGIRMARKGFGTTRSSFLGVRRHGSSSNCASLG